MNSPHIVRKITNPAAPPPEAGIHWINTVTGAEYFSVGTSSIQDWILRRNDEYMQSIISAEESARLSADNSLQAQIDNLVSNLDPSALDSLTEIVSAFQSADLNVGSSLVAEISARQSADESLSSALSSEIVARETADVELLSDLSSEISARISGDESTSQVIAQMQANISSLQSVVFTKLKVIVDVTSKLSYIDIPHVVVPNSMTISVGRVMAHQHDDFDISYLGDNQTTRITWVGPFASGGEEQMELGDNVYLTFAHS
jgi:hypothetical protein